MTPKMRKELSLLGALTVVLAGVTYYNFGTDPAPTTAKPTAGARAPSKPRVRAPRSETPTGLVTDVKLELLTPSQDSGSAPGRDPFRFKPKPAPPPPPPPPQPTFQAPVTPPRPPAERIESVLRYVGYTVSQSGRKVATLSYGANVNTAVQFVGVEGDVIEGRYRLLRIEPNAVEVVELTGDGRRARIPYSV
jgi:hypothetical protein